MDKSLRVQVIMAAVDRVTGPLRNVLKGTRGLSTGLKETTERLKALNAAQRDVGRFRELKAGAAATARELGEAREKAAALARQVNATSSPTRKLTRDFEKARAAVNQLEKAHQDQGRELQEVRGRMAAAGAAGKSLAAHERDLRTAIGRTNTELDERKRKLAAVTDHQRRLEKARGGFDKSQELAGNMAGAGATSAGMGAAILAPLVLANRAAGDYESTLTTVAQKANLNRKAAKSLGVELTAVGKSTNQLPAEVVAATDALTGLGAELGQARQMIPGIAKASTAYGSNMEEMGRATYAAVDTLGVAANKSGKVLDVMATAGKRGAFEVGDMAQHFPSLTAAAAGLGQKGVGAVADLAAALQITRKGAGDSAEAATNLGNLLQKISAPLTTKNFKKFGIDLEAELKAAAKRGESPIETITKLTDKATKGDLSKLGYLFEDAQVQKALRPLIQNLGEYRAIRAEAFAAEGTVNADFAERMRDQNEATKAAGIGVRALGLQIGANLAPTVTTVANLVRDATGAMTTWAQKNPELAGNLAKVAAVVGVLLIVLGGIALAVAAVLGPLALANLAFVQALPILGLLKSGVMLAARAVLFLGRAFLLNPVGLAITAIALAAFLLIRYWKPISAFFGRLWAGIKGAAGSALAWLRGAIPQVGRVLLGMLGPVGLIIANWSRIGPFFVALWGKVKGAAGAAVAWFQGLGAKFRQFGANLIDGLIAGITGRLAALKNTVVGVAGKAADWFKGKLGIHSPSRVFAGFGGDTMAGLQLGLQRGQGGPLDLVRRIAGELAGTMADGVGKPRPVDLVEIAPPGPPGGRQAAGERQALALVRTAATALQASLEPREGRNPAPPPAAPAGGRQAAETARQVLSLVRTAAAGLQPALAAAAAHDPRDQARANSANLARIIAATVAAAGPVGIGGVAAAAARPAPAAAPAFAPAAGDTVHIHIHPAPGADAQAIARAVAAELDRRDRAKHARTGSSLADHSET